MNWKNIKKPNGNEERRITMRVFHKETKDGKVPAGILPWEELDLDLGPLNGEPGEEFIVRYLCQGAFIGQRFCIADFRGLVPITL